MEVAQFHPLSVGSFARRPESNGKVQIWPTAGTESDSNLQRIDLQIQIFVLDETIDSISKYTLQVALTGTTSRICSHHSRYGSVRPKE